MNTAGAEKKAETFEAGFSDLSNARVTSYVPTADQVERGAYGSRPVVSRWLSPAAGRRMADAVLVMLRELWRA